MEKFKEFLKKYYSKDLPMRLCTFNLMTTIGITASLLSSIVFLFIESQRSQVYVMLPAALILSGFLYLANECNRLNLAAILICIVTGLVLFPLMFILGGGVYSGMPVWFILIIVFTTILIEGRIKYYTCGFIIFFYIMLIAYAYNFPDKLEYFTSDKMVFMDIAMAIGFVGISVVGVISLQLYLNNNAFQKAEKATKEAERARVEAERAKEEAEKAKEEAIAANASKSSFLANMSHEIRTPMSAIIGMNEMIQRECTEESIRDYSKDVATSANALLAIINDILDFSKIDSGKMTIIESEYDLKALIYDSADIGNVMNRGKNIDYKIIVDDSLPCRLYGDDLRLRQCIINIISNAFKYTKEGSITFEVSGDTDEDHVKLTFSITDTGQGIKEEDIEKLFESFVRIEESQNRSIQGTGLGLNITSRLLSLMGSRLNVESTYGKGSRFYFTVEQKIIDSNSISSLDSKEGPSGKQAVHMPAFTAPNARILVVDDTRTNLKLFCALLKKSQMTIDTAAGGEEAIELIRNNKYDMVFLDHMMPNMDGVETLEKLNEEHLVDDIPIIMLTANAIVGMREQFIEKGFTDYLSKPIDFTLLEEMLSKYIIQS